MPAPAVKIDSPGGATRSKSVLRDASDEEAKQRKKVQNRLYKRASKTRDAIIKSIAGGLMSSVQLDLRDLRDLRKGLLQPQTRQRKPEQKKAVAWRRGTKSYGSRSQSII
ncbi:hypothetical protein FOTG_01212 [Fusarium oxysporum f. sp. vasinfectum 25433]|uniref:Uncharacterized protein n=1 Tax=Fusarium oxysporum f. sp. vasinfectum 25433 TaxID=1089449 RepID=X0NP03_FUSOX|nr:hypothetical protein FOTG_01212 [Fusarium oxysporum f. sp. vasinfectum 25433]